MMYKFIYYLAQLDASPLPQTPDSQGKIIGIINTVLVILSSVAIVVIVTAGIRYILSRGDSGTIAKSKNAIIYAILGLIIAMSSGAIVNFVLRGL